MKGIPSKLNTKQDLVNVCETLHHARAGTYLKGLDPAEMKRLSVTGRDIKQIKADLAHRKRKETLANRKLARLKEAHKKACERVAGLEEEIDAKRKAIKGHKADARDIPAGETEFKRLHDQLKKVGSVKAGLRTMAVIQAEMERWPRALRDAKAQAAGASGIAQKMAALQAERAEIRKIEKRLAELTPAEALEAELEEAARGLKTARAAAARIPGLERTLVLMNKELSEIRKLKKRLADLTPTEALEAESEETAWNLKTAACAGDVIDWIERELKRLGRELAETRRAEKQRTEAGKLKARIKDVQDELKALREGAAAIEQQTEDLVILERDLKAARAGQAELKSALKAEEGV